MSNICPNCGAENTADSKFCENCGYRFSGTKDNFFNLSNELPDYRESFFSGLFDLSFKTFITPIVVRIYYIIGILFSGFVSIFILFIYKTGDASLEMFRVIASIILFFSILIAFRLMAEFSILFFKIANYLAEIEHLLRKSAKN